MSVIRGKHNRENPYVSLNKSVLFDEKISLKAKGLWAQCLARPNDWKFYISEMVKKCKEGRRSIYSAIDELIENNYAIRLEHYEKEVDGRFKSGGVEYVFFEFQPTDEEKNECIEEFKKCFPQCGFGNARNGDCRNEPLLNTDKEPKNDKEEKNVCYPSPSDLESETIESKIDLKKESSLEARRGMKFPQEVKKSHPDGTEVVINLADIFKSAISSKKDWKTSEIHDAWEILISYSGLVRDSFSFIEGTIKNLRNKERSKFLKSKGKEACKLNNNQIDYIESRKTLSVKGIEEHPSLQFLLEQ